MHQAFTRGVSSADCLPAQRTRVSSHLRPVEAATILTSSLASIDSSVVNVELSIICQVSIPTAMRNRYQQRAWYWAPARAKIRTHRSPPSIQFSMRPAVIVLVKGVSDVHMADELLVVTGDLGRHIARSHTFILQGKSTGATALPHHVLQRPTARKGGVIVMNVWTPMTLFSVAFADSSTLPQASCCRSDPP
jgi:hypothetical protein